MTDVEEQESRIPMLPEPDVEQVKTDILNLISTVGGL